MDQSGDTADEAHAPRSRWRKAASEVSGACGDLGTFIPHVVGAITVAGLAPAGVLIGFSAFYIASGLFYALPMAVQPMKAVSAVLLTGQVGASEIAAAGLLLGAAMLVLGPPAPSAGSPASFRSPSRPACNSASASRWACSASS